MKKVYLDNANSTPVDPRVSDVMDPYIREKFGNPSSLHDYGVEAKKAIDDARKNVADLISADPGEIFFTSSGSESNNFAVKGIAFANQTKGNHVIASSVEHVSVLHSIKFLEKFGFKVTLLPVDKYGTVSPDELKKAITKETVLIAVMHASNEVGTIEPIEQLAQIAAENKIPFHCDGVQTVGTVPVDVKRLKVSTMSFSAQQFYGPKGIAALYISKGTRVIPFIDGGIQEEGRRAGTENVPGIVGLGMAADLAKDEMKQRIDKSQKLRDKLISELSKKVEDSVLTGHPKDRLPGHASFCVNKIEGESMTMFLNMDGVAASTGSACVSRALKASHVLSAMGVDPVLAQGSIMFSIGKDNSEEDIDHVLEKLPPIVERLRAMSPLR